MLSSCHRYPEPIHSTSHIRMMDDTLINLNRKVIQLERQDIDDYISRHGWRMQTTSTGLRYFIYRNGSGQRARKGEIAVISYTLNLLDGTIVEKSDSTKPKEFLIGHGGVESGLEEGILLMRKGDAAKFIIPSHLAFGLIGDQERIPERSALVYDIHLIDLRQFKPAR